MDQNQNRTTFGDVCSTIGRFVKENLGLILGGVALGAGAGIDAGRRIKRKNVKIADNDGNIVEAQIDDLGSDGSVQYDEPT